MPGRDHIGETAVAGRSGQRSAVTTPQCADRPDARVADLRRLYRFSTARSPSPGFQIVIFKVSSPTSTDDAEVRSATKKWSNA